MEDSRKYIVESEKLIRNHGLPKPVKSQKVSKLHHIFSYLNITEESAIRKTKISSREDELRARTSSSLASPGSQLINSRLDWRNEDEANDSEDSLFMSIYQIPTTLLSLLSQTSSLCKDLLLSTRSPTSEYFCRYQILEDRIFNWRPPENLTLEETPQKFRSLELESSDRRNCSTVSAHIVAAMHNALIVHFPAPRSKNRSPSPPALRHEGGESPCNPREAESKSECTYERIAMALFHNGV